MIRQLKKVYGAMNFNVLMSDHKVERAFHLTSSNVPTYAFIDYETSRTRRLALPGGVVKVNGKCMGILTNFYDLTKEPVECSVCIHGVVNENLMPETLSNAEKGHMNNVLIIAPKSKKTPSISCDKVKVPVNTKEEIGVVIKLENARWLPLAACKERWTITGTTGFKVSLIQIVDESLVLLKFTLLKNKKGNIEVKARKELTSAKIAMPSVTAVEVV